MKNLIAIIFFLVVYIVPNEASADFTIGCSHWELAPGFPEHIYNWCEVTLMDEQIVAGVTQIAIDSNWESDVYYQNGSVWELDAIYDEDYIDEYPGPFVTGSVVNDWAGITDVHGRVKIGSQLLNHDEYCWTTNFLYYVTGTGWTTYTSDIDCEFTSGFTF